MVAPTHLRSLQALELALRKGSFVAAGQALGITPAAVGQRVKALEDYLGLELLARGRSGLRAAPGAEAALPHLTRAFAELETAAQELELQRGQEIHLAAASDFVELWLRPRLDGFRAANPNVRFNINGEGDAPLRLGRIDCEISYGAARDAERTDLLFRDFVVPVTSPLNVERTALAAPESRLEGFPLVHLDFYKDDPAGLSWPDWVAANGVQRSAPERGLRFRRITAALDAVAADAGVTLCGLALIGDQVDRGAVGLPYPIGTGRWSEHGFQARFRADTQGRRHVQRFRQWLAEESRATRTWLAAVAGPQP
ncbi:LysR substrate-binding domain-containing protein [Phenylobacterium sp.]|uniref:LysR substrate-binding domain-containing protein n=1 Tax=Phenylobacterium sp. TaxID=1871053 RepID=UPI0035B012DD